MIFVGFKILTYQAFAPTDISGLKAWYDASTLTGADGSSVSTWLDSSGNEANMFQSTTAAQPTLQTNELNGRNVVRFDGVDDFMNLTAPFDVLPTSNSSVNVCDFSPNGDYLVHLNAGVSPFIFIYKKNGNSFKKLSNPAILPAGTVYGCSWSPDSVYLTVNHANSPYLTIYKRSGDTFIKLSNPTLIPNSSTSGSNWSNDGNYLAISGPFSTPSMRLFLYKRSGDTFTAIANSATLPTGGDARATRFSTNDSFLALGTQFTPYIYFYSFDKSTDTLIKINDPLILPGAEVFSIDWLDDITCAVGFVSSTVRIYQYNGLTFEEISSIPTNLSSIYSLRYSKNKSFLAVGGQFSPYVKLYSVSGTTYTALSNPVSLPLGQARGVSWGINDNSLVVSHVSTPYIQAYKFDGTTLTNMNRLNMLRNVGGGSIFIIRKCNSFSITTLNMSITTTSSGGIRMYSAQLTTNKVRTSAKRLDADVTANLDAITSSTSGFEILSHIVNYANSDAYFYLNGTLDASSTTFLTNGNTSDTDSATITIGSFTGSGFLSGDIAEILVYNRALSTSEISNIHQYLSRKWGITLA